MKLLAVGVLMLGLAACSGADSDEAEPDTQAALQQAAQDYSDAYLTGDAEAGYLLLSDRCKERMSESEFSTLVEAAASIYGSAIEFKSFSADVNDEQARVTYTFPDNPEIDQEDEPWVDEGGWRQDDC